MHRHINDVNLFKKTNFGQYHRNELGNNFELLEKMFFDRCKFSLPGRVNQQNCRIRGSKRPREVYEAPQNPFLFIVWCTVFQKEVTGP